MNKFFKHLGLVNAHRFRVFLNGCKCGIGFHCLFHDLSKYGPTEFLRSVKFFDGTHSPVLEERLEHNYFSLICQHHTRRNKHHWEYWVDFFQGNIIALTMPWKYAVEYVCDVISAAQTYDPKGFKRDAPYLYFNKKKDHYFTNKGTAEFVTYCLKEFAENGWKNLHKKQTKAKYEEISKNFKEIDIFETEIEGIDFPKLKN